MERNDWDQIRLLEVLDKGNLKYFLGGANRGSVVYKGGGKMEEKGEPGSHYVMDKVALPNKRAYSIQEEKIISYLITRLFNSNQKAAIMSRDLRTIDRLMEELRHLEALGLPEVGLSENRLEAQRAASNAQIRI